MSNVVIPTAANERAFRVRTTLTGFEFVFDFAFNEREGFWYFNLLDESGVPIALGVKVIIGYPLLVDVTDPRRPFGEIIALDNTGKDVEAGVNDLSPPNPRVSLLYMDTLT